MIAKQRRSAPPARASAASARAASGFCRAAAAGRDAREIGGPRDQPVDDPREARLALVLAAGVDARGEPRRATASPAPASAASHARRSACTRGIGMRERRAAARRPPARAPAPGPPRPARRATRARRPASGMRRRAACGSARRIVGRQARRADRDDEDQIRARPAAPRASSAARSPRPAFIRSAGAITATLARWRWLVSCDEVDQRAHAVDRDRVDGFELARLRDRSAGARAACRSGCWPAIA